MTDPASQTPREPGLLSRGETTTRRGGLVVAAGMVAYVAGVILTDAIVTRLVAHQVVVSLPVEWLLNRVWLLALLPLLAWPVGRFGIASPATFAVWAALSAEAFDALVASAVGGLEAVFPTFEDTVARVATLVLGIGLNWFVAWRGARAASQADAVAEVLAEAQAKALRERINQLEAPAGGLPPAAPPGPSPAGEAGSPPRTDVPSE